jgi:hypothetical protein
MSSRFHNKYHRHNHHTRSEGDPRYPDATHDPIASPDAPFLGPFYLLGTLSAASLGPFNVDAPPAPAGVFAGDPTGLVVTAPLTGTAILALGNVQVDGNFTVNGLAKVQDFEITGNLIRTYSNPVTATGDFLQVKINDTFRAIRLWQYD